MMNQVVPKKHWSVLALALLMLMAAAPQAQATLIDLSAPYAALPFFDATDLGNNDRTVIMTAFNNLDIDSVGVMLDPTGVTTPFTLGVVVYSYDPTTNTRGAEIDHATFSFAADAGKQFYVIPFSFSFVSGSSYELGVYALPSPPGFGNAQYLMELQHFDQGYCAAHTISCPPYDVAGALTILEGGACADTAPGGPPDCVGSTTTYLNDNFPHLALIQEDQPPSEIPEPMTLSLAGLGLVGLGWLGQRQRRKSR